jgi:hypothetical protein
MNHTNHAKPVFLVILLSMAGCETKIQESVFNSLAFVYENPFERFPPTTCMLDFSLIPCACQLRNSRSFSVRPSKLTSSVGATDEIFSYRNRLHGSL